jgi:hypothetical protein
MRNSLNLPTPQNTQPQNWGSVLGSILGKIKQGSDRREAYKQANYEKAKAAEQYSAQQQGSFNQLYNMYQNKQKAETQNFQNWANIYNNATDDDTRQKAATQLNLLARGINPNLDLNNSNAWTQAMGQIGSNTDTNVTPYTTALNNMGNTYVSGYDPTAANAFQTIQNALQGNTDYYKNYQNSQANNTVSGNTFQNLQQYTMANPNAVLLGGLPNTTTAIPNVNTSSLTPYVYIKKDGEN